MGKRGKLLRCVKGTWVRESVTASGVSQPVSPGTLEPKKALWAGNRDLGIHQGSHGNGNCFCKLSSPSGVGDKMGDPQMQPCNMMMLEGPREELCKGLVGVVQHALV